MQRASQVAIILQLATAGDIRLAVEDFFYCSKKQIFHILKETAKTLGKSRLNKNRWKTRNKGFFTPKNFNHYFSFVHNQDSIQPIYLFIY